MSNSRQYGDFKAQQAYYGSTGQVPTYGYGSQPVYPQQPVFPQQPAGSMIQGGLNAPSLGPQVPGMLPLEESYIENILRLNKGKLATVYATFENNREWNAKIFKGIIEAAGRDHIILSDPQTGMRYLILMIYVDYVTFDEEIEYEYGFGSTPGMASYSPR
ncbi:spore coat protein GerQ [Cytobacillus spongiae]|uniref:spore coat protein GerQ n=1 Tax=Cytobacillus spongiae TaxID=2901381 RepID=UPI001F2A7750|nr:spore coat protein GerQ [Cytobacillus spongiae]UII55797.1 spore coat protein GerQ [Cytobacillus spongiae]